MANLIYPLSGNTNSVLLDDTTKTPWTRNSGDWLDANGVLNGPAVTVSASGTTATVAIGGMGDVLIQGINSVSQVVVDGVDVTSQCFWLNSSSGGSLAMPSLYGSPVVVPYGGSVMTVTGNTGGGWRVDRVAVQSVPALATLDASYYHAPDLLRVDPTSYAAMRNVPGAIPGPSGNIFVGPTNYLTDASSGVAYVQCQSAGALYPATGNGRIARCDYPVGAQSSLYVGYLLKIGLDVWEGCADLGVKLSGPTGDESIFFIGEHSCSVAIGGVPNPRNPNIFALWDYFADQEKNSSGNLLYGPGNGGTSSPSFLRFMANQFVFIEHGATCNTFDVNGNPNVDGIARTWVNGVLVQDIRRPWFSLAASRWQKLSLQIYMGGTQSWRQVVTYGIGPYMASTQRIGIPPDIAVLLQNQSGTAQTPSSPAPKNDTYTAVHGATVAGGLTLTPPSTMPAWRRAGTVKDTIYQIAGTSNVISTTTGSAGVVDVFTGYTVTDSQIFALPASGHWANFEFRNAVYRLDLTQDAPAWTEYNARTTTGNLADPTTLPGHNLDGKPWPSQTYNHQWFLPGAFAPDGKDRCILLWKSVCAVPSGMQPYDKYETDGFRIADNAWDAAGTWNPPIFRDYGSHNWSGGRDPNTGYIYYGNGRIVGPDGGIARFKANLGTGGTHETIYPGIVTGVPGNWVGWSFRGLACDTKRNRIVSFNHASGLTVARLEWVDLTTMAFGTLTTTGGVPSGGGSGRSMVYDPDNDRYLAAMDNGDIWTIDPVTAVSSLLLTCPATVNGINNRFGYLKNYKCLVWHSTASANVVFIPTVNG